MRIRDKKHRPTAWVFLLVPLLAGILVGLSVAAQLQPQVVAVEPTPIPVAPILSIQELVEEPEETPAPELVGTFTLYAYCGCERCCGKWAQYNLTASGTTPEEGRTVAADWDVLPSGTEIYIDGIGWRTVEDTGSGIDGQALDVYMDSHQAALEFGVQSAEVYR